MKLHARRVDVAPNPLAVARSVFSEPGFAFLWNAPGESTIACRPVETSAELDPEPSLPLEPGLGPLAASARWIGLLPYEARRELERPGFGRTPEDREPPLVSEIRWARYPAVVRVGTHVLVVGDDPGAVTELAAQVRRGSAGREPSRVRLAGREPDAVHLARIRRALELIVQGEIYQVNLARRFDFSVRGSALSLLEGLTGGKGPRFGGAFGVDGLRVAVSSPELFLELAADGRLVTCPIKGTRPRGSDAAADAALARELDENEKERAELAMVVDVERNDLGRIARTGSVRVPGAPRVEAFGTVHHRVATVTARLAPGRTRREVLLSMLPSGSVTGAPKVRAMELIADLEAARRGFYTGAFGALRHDGSLSLGMAIRTLVARDDLGHYFAGGGIVYGSDPEREVEETRWKAARVLGDG